MAYFEQLTAQPSIREVTIQRAPGWWDSFQVSSDGTRLYFAHSRYNIWSFLALNPIVVCGGYPGHQGNALPASPYKDFCLFDCALTGAGGTPQSITPLALNVASASYTSQHMSGAVGSRKVIYIINDNSGFNQIATQTETGVNMWGAQNVAEMVTLNTWGYSASAQLDNPSVDTTDTTMFLSGDKVGKLGIQDLWISTKSVGVWGVPVNAGATLNGAGITNDQPFLGYNNVDLWWTRSGVIWHTTWGGGTTFTAPGPITFAGGSDFFPGASIGEFTVVNGGARCYFIRFDPVTQLSFLCTATNAGTPKTWNAPSLVETAAV